MHEVELYTRADTKDSEFVHEVEVKFKLTETALNVYRRNASLPHRKNADLDTVIVEDINDDVQEYLWRYAHSEYDHDKSLEWNIAYYNGELTEE